MSCPERQSTGRAPLRPVIAKEMRDLFLGRAFWAAILIVIFLTGYSFVQAVNLYSEASRSALQSPELARGLSPLDGIFVPTFGALYLVVSFLFPFIVIRTVGAEKQSGALKMLIQMPYSTPVLLAAKLTTAIAAWMFMLLPCLFALALWSSLGGHINAYEVVNLVCGHFLYATVIAGISLVTASVSESPASAAIGAVGLTIAFWVLDFAAAGDNGLLKSLSGLSLTAVLRTFERGVFSFGTAAGSLLAALFLAATAGIWIHPGRSATFRVGRTAALAMMAAVAIAAATQVHLFWDTTEDRRNSFSRADETVLRSMRGRLVVEVHLGPQDPRLYDLERSILDKLRRTLPNVNIALLDVGTGRGSTDGGDQYGHIVYRYNDREAASRSTSEEEVLPLILEMAGLKRPLPEEKADYPGYPLVVDTRWAKLGFYGLLPLAVLISWFWAHGGLGVIEQNRKRGGIA